MKVILCVLVLFVSGCATKGTFLSSSDTGWFNLETQGIGCNQSDLVWCKASEAGPKCYFPQVFEPKQ